MQPTARSLTLDLLSTQHRGTMPVRALVAAADLFSIGENSLRVSLARLFAAGSVERDERGRYRLARIETPLKRQVLGWRAIETRMIDGWSGDWVAVIGAPRGRRGEGKRSNRALALLGFRTLRPGLSVRPDNLVGGVAAVRERYAGLCAPTRNDAAERNASDSRPNPDTVPVVARLTDLEELDIVQARTLFGADALEREYAQLIGTLRESEARLESLSASDAMIESFLVGGRVLRALNVDPLLPDPIVDVAARKSLVEAMLRYDVVGRGHWARFLASFDAPHMKLRDDGSPSELALPEDPIDDVSIVADDVQDSGIEPMPTERFH